MDAELKRKFAMALYGYLPYGVKGHAMGMVVPETEFNDNPTPIEYTLTGISLDPKDDPFVQLDNWNECVLEEFFLILRPMEDLLNMIEHNGEKFVPYDRFKEVVDNDQWVKICGTVDRKIYKKVCDMPHWWVKLCYKYHFDVDGLIEDKLAIDINTLKN